MNLFKLNNRKIDLLAILQQKQRTIQRLYKEIGKYKQKKKNDSKSFVFSPPDIYSRDSIKNPYEDQNQKGSKHQYESKYIRLKQQFQQFVRLIKNAKCRKCNKQYQIGQFIEHLQQCIILQVDIDQNQLQIKINRINIYQNQKLSSFVMQIQFKDQSWKIKRHFTQLQAFLQHLCIYNPIVYQAIRLLQQSYQNVELCFYTLLSNYDIRNCKDFINFIDSDQRIRKINEKKEKSSSNEKFKYRKQVVRSVAPDHRIKTQYNLTSSLSQQEYWMSCKKGSKNSLNKSKQSKQNYESQDKLKKDFDMDQQIRRALKKQKKKLNCWK